MGRINRHSVLALCGALVFAGLFVGICQVQADYIVGGVYSDTPPPESTRPEVVSPENRLVLDRFADSQRPLESPGGAPRQFIKNLKVTAFIDFDDVTAPCAFIETQALRDEYASLGVTFEGPGPLDGGAILDECGSFGVTGHSSPNFLAFNPGATLSTGGIPQGPETMHFDPSVNYVQFLAGDIFGGTLTAEAYDVSDNLIASDSVTMQAELQPDVKGDLRLVDSEDRDEAEITVSRPLLDRYQRTLASFIDGARTFCTRRGMTYLLANTTVPVDEMVTQYLRQRGLVR